MTGLFKQKVNLGQGDGSEVELIVTGTALYATYETLDGFPAVYDDGLELFCYARVVDGRFESTGVPVGAQPPLGVDRHARESDAVRAARIVEREAHMEQASHGAHEHERSEEEE